MQGFEASSQFNMYYNVPASPVSPLSASNSNDCSYSIPLAHYNQNYAYNYGYNYSSPANYYYMPNPNGYVAYNNAPNTNSKATPTNISTRNEPSASSCFYTPSSSYYNQVSVGFMLLNQLYFNISIFCLLIRHARFPVETNQFKVSR